MSEQTRAHVPIWVHVVAWANFALALAAIWLKTIVLPPPVGSTNSGAFEPFLSDTRMPSTADI